MGLGIKSFEDCFTEILGLNNGHREVIFLYQDGSGLTHYVAAGGTYINITPSEINERVDINCMEEVEDIDVYTVKEPIHDLETFMQKVKTTGVN